MSDSGLKAILLVLLVSATLVTGMVVFSWWTGGNPQPEDIDDIYNEWVKTYSGIVELEQASVVECQGGGFALAFSGISTSTDYDARIIRVDENGSIIWEKNLVERDSDSIGGLTECSNGDLVITGYSAWVPDDEPSDRGLWVTRMIHNGTVLWHNVYSGFDMGGCVVECQNGNLAIAAEFSHLVRMDSSGNVLWNRTYGSWEISVIYSLIDCEDGGLALAGYVDIDPSGHYNFKAWLLRVDADGVEMWNRTYGGSDSEFGVAEDIRRCSDDGFVLTGSKAPSGYSGGEFWLVRTFENGSMMWNRTYCYGCGFAAVECPDGGFAAVGRLVSSGYPYYEAVLIRTDALGDPLWSSVCSGPDWDEAYSLALCQSGGFVVAGMTSYVPYLWRLADSSIPVSGTVTIQFPATTTTVTGLAEIPALRPSGSRVNRLTTSYLALPSEPF